MSRIEEIAREEYARNMAVREPAAKPFAEEVARLCLEEFVREAGELFNAKGYQFDHEAATKATLKRWLK